jgi:Mg2+/citrate symporter
MAELFKILLPALIIVALAFIGLAISILIRKNGRFPDTHIHSNKHLQEKDIHCVQKEDALEQRKARKKTDFRNLKYIRNSGKSDYSER